MAHEILHQLSLLWLPVASLLGGALNTIAGGGSFLTLPPLIASGAAAHGGIVTAQATNTVALWPGQLTSTYGFRHDLRDHRRHLLPIAIAAGLGGAFGGLLLLHTSNRSFARLLPWLLLFASTLFVLSFPLGKWLARRHGGRRSGFWLFTGMVAASIYVGYFGAGGGFIVLALLGVCGVQNIHEMNAIKTISAFVSLGVPVVTFIIAGRVEWRYCLIMALLAGLGGLAWLLAHVGIGPVLGAVGRLGWGGFAVVVAFHLGLIVAMG
jgi:uncharacterized membrane protein YfcA